jgi:minor extracellular protease Epr
MGKRFSFIMFLVLLSAVLFGPISFGATNNNEQVLIRFEDKTDVSLVKQRGGIIRHAYKNMPIVAATISKKEIEALKKNPHVKYVETDYEVQATGEVVPWGVSRIEAIDVHPYTVGSGIKIAILDTGIDATHQDLVVAGGYSAVDYASSYFDDNGHGTHIAGTVASVHNNLGIIGVAPSADIYGVKVLDTLGSGYISDVVEGIDWAISNEMHILNMSLGTSIDSEALRDTCDRAYAEGIILVAAVGNNSSADTELDNVLYPARYPSVIGVGAIDNFDQRALFSSTGPNVELVAPGMGIYSTLPAGLYGYSSGTSMASSYVTGTAALVWALNANMTNTELRQKLDSTAIDLGLSGKDNQFGYGLVNAKNALGVNTPSKLMSGSIGTDKETYSVGETISITVFVTDEGGDPVANASINLDVISPRGQVYTRIISTDITGKSYSSYSPSRKDGKGTYGINVTINKPDYPAAQNHTIFKVINGK